VNIERNVYKSALEDAAKLAEHMDDTCDDPKCAYIAVADFAPPGKRIAAAIRSLKAGVE
jgi:hypothetical protein